MFGDRMELFTMVVHFPICYLIRRLINQLEEFGHKNTKFACCAKDEIPPKEVLFYTYNLAFFKVGIAAYR